MKKNKREIISLDQISFFIDSINSFYIDLGVESKLIIKGGATSVEKSFYSDKDAVSYLNKLAEKLMLNRDVALFADKYIVSDKVSLIDFGKEDDYESRVVRIFFKNGDFIDTKISEDEKTEEVLQDFFDDLKLGKTLKTEKYLFVLEKITGFEIGNYKEAPALLIGVEGPELVPVFNFVDYYLEKLKNLINWESDETYS